MPGAALKLFAYSQTWFYPAILGSVDLIGEIPLVVLARERDLCMWAGARHSVSLTGQRASVELSGQRVVPQLTGEVVT